MRVPAMLACTQTWPATKRANSRRDWRGSAADGCTALASFAVCAVFVGAPLQGKKRL